MIPFKFCIHVSVVLLFVAFPLHVFASCKPDHIDETVAVRYVHDGDTVILHDGRKLRLIGLDSPEIYNKQPYAKQARDYLRRLLKRNRNTLQLHYDIEHRDRYKRVLAHAFLLSGASVSQLLIQQGLATALIIPPNLQLADCYSFAEDQAQQRQAGIWQLAQYQTVAIEDLKPGTKGYRVVRGQVDKIYQHRGSTFIQISHRSLLVRISANDKPLFAPDFMNQLLHRKIEIKGKLRRDKHKKYNFYMRLRHPGALQILD